MPKPSWNYLAPRSDVNNARGNFAQSRFLTGMESMQSRYPEWLLSFYAGTPEDDQQGIDVWAKIDIGLVPIQVKSSNIGRVKHQQKENRRHILCIAVPKHLRFDAVFCFTISHLTMARKRMLSERSTQVHPG